MEAKKKISKKRQAKKKQKTENKKHNQPVPTNRAIRSTFNFGLFAG